MSTRATRLRNAIGLIVNPDTGTLWAGGAGQDNLPLGHPYEFFDAVTAARRRRRLRLAEVRGEPATPMARRRLLGTVAPHRRAARLLDDHRRASSIPTAQTGKHAFPAAYRGLYLTGHGSWHMTGNIYYTPPRVAFVAMNGDAPATPVDWSDPSKQWTRVRRRIPARRQRHAHRAADGNRLGIARAACSSPTTRTASSIASARRRSAHGCAQVTRTCTGEYHQPEKIPAAMSAAVRR